MSHICYISYRSCKSAAASYSSPPPVDKGNPTLLRLTDTFRCHHLWVIESNGIDFRPRGVLHPLSWCMSCHWENKNSCRRYVTHVTISVSFISSGGAAASSSSSSIFMSTNWLPQIVFSWSSQGFYWSDNDFVGGPETRSDIISKIFDWENSVSFSYEYFKTITFFPNLFFCKMYKSDF